MYTVKRITIEQVTEVVHLFDAYRIFYNMESDRNAGESFLKQRLSNGESVIFVAYEDEVVPVGFTQLFFTFSSVSLKESLILNDLYVSEEHRKNAIGEQLLLKAQEYCNEKGFKGLALETAIDNPAQTLYERLGWKKQDSCFHYFWPANG